MSKSNITFLIVVLLMLETAILTAGTPVAWLGYIVGALFLIGCVYGLVLLWRKWRNTK